MDWLIEAWRFLGSEDNREILAFLGSGSPSSAPPAGRYHAQSRYAEAEPLYRRALAIAEGPRAPNVFHRCRCEICTEGLQWNTTLAPSVFVR